MTVDHKQKKQKVCHCWWTSVSEQIYNHGYKIFFCLYRVYNFYIEARTSENVNMECKKLPT